MRAYRVGGTERDGRRSTGAFPAPKKSEITEICKRALEEYEQTGSVKGIHTLIENYVSYRSISWFHDLWSRFILDVTGASRAEKG